MKKANNKYRLDGASAGIYEIDPKGQLCDDGTMVSIERLIEKVLAILLKEAENKITKGNNESFAAELKSSTY